MTFFQHQTSDVSTKAKIGKNVKIWHFVQVREKAEIGDHSTLGKGVYVDSGVRIGKNVKIQNRASIYHGATIEDGVFIGPHVCFTNDKNPRAINKDGLLKNDKEWTIGRILVKKGASIGANSVILPDVTIGRYALIGAGSVVTKDIPDYGLAYGNPAIIHGRVNKSGNKVK